MGSARMWGKAGAWAAGGLLAAATVSGITYAADSGSSTTPATGSAVSGVPASQLGSQAAAGQRLGGRRMLLRRLEHGSLVVDGKSGERDVQLQRGTVKSVSSTSISVTSKDGFAKTYPVTDQTRVRTRDGLTSMSSVHDGDQVLVIALDGNAVRVLVAPAAATG